MSGQRRGLGRWLTHRSLRTKLLLLVGVLATVSVGIGWLSLDRLREVQRAGDDVYTDAMGPALHAAEVKVLILAKRNTALRHASAPDDANKLRYDGVFREYAADLQRTLTAYPTPSEAGRINELRSLASRYDQILINEYFVASLRHDPAVVQRARDRASPLADGSLVLLDALIADQNARALAIYQQVSERYDSARTVIVAALLIGLGLALSLSLYTARLIVRPLRRVEWVADGLAAGDLTRSSDVSGTGEIARLAQALDQAVSVRRVLEGELVQRNAELLRLSTTDLLTDLANRRHLEQRLAEAENLVRRHGGDFSVLLLDVDHFKRVNDELGHHNGDLVLRAVADRISSVLRREDLAGRWGGEEFMVLLPSTDLAGALALAERVRVAVSTQPIPLSIHHTLTVTVSVGAASGPRAGVADLVHRADNALYAAKANGRNCVVAAPMNSPPTAVPAHLGSDGPSQLPLPACHPSGHGRV